jgi:hypothetical protein
MIDNWLEYCHQLYQELTLLLCSELSGTERIEACFKCTLLHLAKLKQLVNQTGFTDDPEEIHFFKHIKPQFTGRLEYYTLIYNFQLFHPIDNPFDLYAYCHRERQKVVKFTRDQETFIQYYTEGRTDHDALFFLRRNYEAESRPYSRVFDQDPGFAAAFDWIAALHIGNDLYDRFLLEQMKQSGALF